MLDIIPIPTYYALSLSLYRSMKTEYEIQKQQEKAKDMLQKDLKSHQAKHPEHKGHIDTDQDKPSATGQRGILE